MSYDYRGNRPFFYHLLDDPAFPPTPFSTLTKTDVAPFARGAPLETKTFYSLTRDLAELRRIGRQKGIVDDSVTTLGPSLNGRDLLAIKIGKTDDHKALVTGCHHAREWISVEMAYLLAELLVLRYADNPTDELDRRIKHLVDNRRIWIVPLVNPDGHVFTLTANRNWRPNRRVFVAAADQTLSAPRLGGGTARTIRIRRGMRAEGVDVNRNYATRTWGQETFHPLGPVETSRDPADAGEDSVWCGTDRESEPEATAVGDLVRREQFRVALSYHSYGLLVIRQHDNVPLVDWAGDGMRGLIFEVHARPYRYVPFDVPYATTGDQIELCDDLRANHPFFTAEVRPADADPAAWQFSGLPEDQIGPCFEENALAAMALINAAPFDARPAEARVTLPGGTAGGTVQVVRDAIQAFHGLRV